MPDSRLGVAVFEQYVAYDPPPDFRLIVDRLLESVPRSLLAGLGAIVLTNFSGQPRRIRLGRARWKGRKFDAAEIQGQYFKASSGSKAWIRIYVDHIVWPKRFHQVATVRDFAVAAVLYHELGHHAQRLQPRRGEKEILAECWAQRLFACHVRLLYGHRTQPCVRRLSRLLQV